MKNTIPIIFPELRPIHNAYITPALIQNENWTGNYTNNNFPARASVNPPTIKSKDDWNDPANILFILFSTIGPQFFVGFTKDKLIGRIRVYSNHYRAIRKENGNPNHSFLWQNYTRLRYFYLKANNMLPDAMDDLYFTYINMPKGMNSDYLQNEVAFQFRLKLRELMQNNFDEPGIKTMNFFNTQELSNFDLEIATDITWPINLPFILNQPLTSLIS
jgi:hypothetical protein